MRSEEVISVVSFIVSSHCCHAPSPHSHCAKHPTWSTPTTTRSYWLTSPLAHTSPYLYTLNPSSRRHLRCASMRYLHFSSSFSGKHASRACLVMGHAQQIFLGFTSGCLLADAPIAFARNRGRNLDAREGVRVRRGRGQIWTETSTIFSFSKSLDSR